MGFKYVLEPQLNGKYHARCAFCDTSFFGDEGWVRVEVQYHLATLHKAELAAESANEFYVHRDPVTGKSRYYRNYARPETPPRFTGFDGIPDWTEKDAEIANLRGQIASLKSIVKLRGNRIDDLEKDVEKWRNVAKLVQERVKRGIVEAESGPLGGYYGIPLFEVAAILKRFLVEGL